MTLYPANGPERKLAAKHELRRVSSPEDWAAMHAIRVATLFAPDRPRSRPVTYDDNHPDDRAPTNQCFLLMLAGQPIGVVRLDRRGADAGVVRLVAISPELQGQGHGRVLESLVEAEARASGMTELLVNAAETALGFYLQTGWRIAEWDPSELVNSWTACIQMRKPL